MAGSDGGAGVPRALAGVEDGDHEAAETEEEEAAPAAHDAGVGTRLARAGVDGGVAHRVGVPPCCRSRTTDGPRAGERRTGGPDRIRTGDLQRDRLACWAATPRVPRRTQSSRAAASTRRRKSASPILGAMPDLIDLRSDTVTQPTPEMRRAMAEAEVGDDVFGDDPTVIALQERAAELTGKEAGLFVASGTMGNLVSHMAHVPRGGEIIAAAESHVVLDEAAGHAVISGASRARGPGRAGRHAWTSTPSVPHPRPDDAHLAPSRRWSCSRTPTAMRMGQPLTADYMAPWRAVAHEHGVPLHVDGARLFNAVVALGTPAARAARGRRQRHLLPLEGPGLPGRLGRRRAPRTSSGARAGRARWSAAACARSASSRRPGSSPCATVRPA